MSSMLLYLIITAALIITGSIYLIEDRGVTVVDILKVYGLCLLWPFLGLLFTLTCLLMLMSMLLVGIGYLLKSLMEVIFRGGNT